MFDRRRVILEGASPSRRKEKHLATSRRECWPVAVRVHCPHCRSLCQVDDAHLRSTVKCGRCAKLFAIRIPVPQPPSPVPAAQPGDSDSANELLLDLAGPAAGDVSAAPSPPSRPSMPLGLACLDLGAATLPGQVRTRNEDSFLIQHLHWSNLDQRHEIALAVV